MPRGNSAPIRQTIGPGILYAAALGTAEPAATLPFPAWPSGWLPLGYTDAGSTFAYKIASDTVEVAEELDPIFTVVTGRTATVSFSLAEPTQFNLRMALNGGVSVITDPASGAAVVFEPPDLGTETRIMLGHQAESGAERWVWRQCFQTGDISMERRKGNNKTLVPVEFSVEKPETGARIFKRMTDTSLKGWPDLVSPTGYEQAVAEVKGAKPTVDIAGETFQLHGRVTTLDVSELARGADLDSGSSEGAALLSEFFRAAFGDHTPEGRREYTRFRRHLRTVEDGDEAMLAGMNACVEAFSGFPTKQPQDFRPPQSRTTRGSKAGGSRRAAPAPEPASTQVVTGELVVDEGEGSEPEAEKPTVVVNLRAPRLLEVPLPLFLGFVLACVSENWNEDRWDEWRDVMDGGDGSPRYVDTDAFDHIAGDVVNL